MSLNKIEKILYGIASAMATAILYTTWSGYARGGYEANPILRRIFDWLYNLTGSFAFSILVFIPVVWLGLYIAVKLIQRDYQKKLSDVGQIFLVAFILLITPTFVNNIFKLYWDNRFIAVAGIFLASLYLFSRLVFFGGRRGRKTAKE